MTYRMTFISYYMKACSACPSTSNSARLTHLPVLLRAVCGAVCASASSRIFTSGTFFIDAPAIIELYRL